MKLENLFKPNRDTKTSSVEKRFDVGGVDGCTALCKQLWKCWEYWRNECRITK